MTKSKRISRKEVMIPLTEHDRVVEPLYKEIKKYKELIYNLYMTTRGGADNRTRHMLLDAIKENDIYVPEEYWPRKPDDKKRMGVYVDKLKR